MTTTTGVNQSTTAAAASSAAAAAANAAKTAKPNAAGYDRDMFLKLLVAQLRYQDPSKPMDSSQFMVQTAQFSQMEQMNELTQATNNTLSFQRVLFSGSLVGRTVEGIASTGASVSGAVSTVEIAGGKPMLVTDNGHRIDIDKLSAIR